jgi:hypothetical protein
VIVFPPAAETGAVAVRDTFSIATDGASRETEDAGIVLPPAAGTGAVAVRDTFSIATDGASRETVDARNVFLPAAGTRAIGVTDTFLIATDGSAREAEDAEIVFLLAARTRAVIVFSRIATFGAVRVAHAATFSSEDAEKVFLPVAGSGAVTVRFPIATVGAASRKDNLLGGGVGGNSFETSEKASSRSEITTTSWMSDSVRSNIFRLTPVQIFLNIYSSVNITFRVY